MKVYKYIHILIFILCLWFPQASFGASENYPKLANYYLKWKIDNHLVDSLAKWDVLILDMQNQFTSESSLLKLKQLNPDIILLAYMTIEEVQDQHQSATIGNPWRDVYDKVNQNNLWLKNKSGNNISMWQGTSMINIASNTWQSWLPSFFQNKILVNDYWDGIFLDNCFDSISWLDSSVSVRDIEWQQSVRKLLQSIDNVLAEDQALVVNSSSSYAELTNGRLYEGWPEVYTGDWKTNTNDYFNIVEKVNNPTTVIINSNTSNQNNPTDYQTMRFGLASTLMSDGYFSFDFGDQDHAQTWWYDEYDQYLGAPLNDPYNLISDNSYGVWQRDFEQGAILINASLEEHRIKLGSEFEKINGTQDPNVNNGRIVTSVNIDSHDGLIVLKRTKSFSNAVFRNGSFAKFYNTNGVQSRNGFFAYDNVAEGNNKVVQIDLDSDGVLDKVVGGNNWIDIYQENEFVKRFYPYTEKYNQGINFSVGDLNDDGWVEIITGTERGGGPQIRIFSSDGRLINPGFFAYSENFRGGVSVAVADINDNGAMEIIAGAGFGGGPHVRIFDKSGTLLSPGFMAFDPNFRGGVTVAVADIDSDGEAEIITTPGRGGQAEIKIFDIRGKLLKQWEVDNSMNELGLELAIVDLDGNNNFDIVAMTRNVFSW
jgi:Hypothetical glycosyl hydrolase family 15/FG-GAP-like repeat